MTEIINMNHSPQEENPKFSVVTINNRCSRENSLWIPFDEETGEGGYYKYKRTNITDLVFVNTSEGVFYDSNNKNLPLLVHISQN